MPNADERISRAGFLRLGVLGVSATALAFVAGYASISFLLRLVTKGSTVPFVVYRVALGVVVLALLATGAIS